MHFLILFVGAVAAVAVWYFRLRGPAAVDDAVDAAGKVRGAYRRNRFRGKVEASTLAAIDDPGLAASVYLVSLAEAGQGLGAEEEEAIGTWLKDVVEYGDPIEALTFAKWAARDVVDVNEVGRRLLPLWRDRLTTEQRLQLIQAATSVADIGGADIAQTEAIRRLRERLAH